MGKNLTQQEMEQLCTLLDKAILHDKRLTMEDRAQFASCSMIIAGIALDEEMEQTQTPTNMPLAYA